jgi:hypothetical protein
MAPPSGPCAPQIAVARSRDAITHDAADEPARPRLHPAGVLLHHGVLVRVVVGVRAAQELRVDLGEPAERRVVDPYAHQSRPAQRRPGGSSYLYIVLSGVLMRGSHSYFSRPLES